MERIDKHTLWNLMSTIITVVIAYLLGSISCSIVLAKLTHKPDPREIGSGNAGATNVLRTAGKNAAIIVLVGDILKGFAALLIAKVFHVHGFGLAVVGLAAVVGHIFPVFFKFKGGKGVATAIGVVLGLSLWIGLLAAVIWIVVLALFRYASLASLIAVAASPFLLAIFSSGNYFLPIAIMAGLVIWKHWDNVERLKNKTEPKVSF